jgi:3-phosphoshikimate 1-carboxyvinyltransferase
MIVRPAKALRGEVSLPGDKSISHRAAMISAISEGESRIENFATSADCASTVKCLRGLGVDITADGSAILVRGVGRNGLLSARKPLDCGNSGTTMRLLAGILAGQDFDSVLTGDSSLVRRPMQRIIEPLTTMGARIEANDGRPPLNIHGSRHLQPIDHSPQVASAQIKSCVLLAGLNADGVTRVTERTSTRDHTERMLRWFGADVAQDLTERGNTISIRGGQELTARPVTIPADISAAAFFLIGAACLGGSGLVMKSVGLNPTRTAVIDAVRKLGARVDVERRGEQNNEPVGDIRVKGGLDPNAGNEIRGETIAQLIDELPILAVLGTRLEGGLIIRDAAELRVKETDRIAAVVGNLRRMGAEVEEFDDGFRVGNSRLKGARVDSFGDHRIAMAFAIAGLIVAEGDTEIDGAECVDVSFPGFFEVLEDVVIYE